MSEFDPLSIGGEHDRVVTNNVTTAQAVHTDLRRGAFSFYSNPAMGNVVSVGGCGFLVQDLKETSGSP